MNDLIDKNAVVSDAITNLIEDAIKSGWSKVKQYFVDENRKEKIDLGLAYEKYLRQTRQKYGKIKTIIYNKVPQELLSFYECVGVRIENDVIDTKNINNITKIDRKIIITGAGGIGKSTMLKYFFLNAIDATNYVPVLVELRNLNSQNSNLSIRDVIFKSLCDNGFEMEDKYFEYSLLVGGYLILLDGFDELNREKSIKIGESINTFTNKYYNNHFIVTSRPSEEFIGWNDFTELQSEPLNKKQAIELIQKLKFDDSITARFIDELKTKLFTKYKSFAQNPLLLTIMFMTYQNHASMPEKLNEFYEQAFLTLFNMHDATKDYFKRDIRTGLGVEDFKTIFSYICFKSYFSDEFEFSDVTLNNYLVKAQNKFPCITFQVSDYQDDLTHAVCMLIKDGLIYHFSHRSFQEYFAAIYTCKLTDSIQTKLLTSRIKEVSSVLSDNFFPMLFEMQSEKINKTIFTPGIKKLREYYNNLGYSIQLLETLFSGIRIKVSNAQKYSTSLIIKDDYVCRVCILTIKLNNLIASDEDNNKKNEIIIKLFNDEMPYNKQFTFDELREVLTDDEILNMVDWYKKHIEVLLQFVQNNKTTILSKRKVKSILEEL